MESLINQITVSQEEQRFFSENGLIKLKQILTSETIEGLRKLTSHSNQLKKLLSFTLGSFIKLVMTLKKRAHIISFLHRIFKML